MQGRQKGKKRAKQKRWEIAEWESESVRIELVGDMHSF